MIRKAAVAGTWYPGTADDLAAAVDRHLAAARSGTSDLSRVLAIISPHAGLMYSGPVAAHAYRVLDGRSPDVIVLVGPSHFIDFEGIAVYADGGFETPLGVLEIDRACAADLMQATRIVHDDRPPHAREHSLAMQLPFLQRVAPAARIVPLLMGRQTAEAARELGEALAKALAGRDAVLVASTDLSHYHDRATAARLDGVVVDTIARFDPDGLQHALDRRPDHACGGGPTVAVMRAAALLGATDARVLNYADSGDVSGDVSAVVGYVAAAIGDARPSGPESAS